MARPLVIVDDDESIRSGLSYALKRVMFAVLSAINGREAWPSEIEGIEVSRQLRLENAVTMIMRTARDGELDAVVGLEVGMDYDLVTILLARLKSVFMPNAIRQVQRSFSGQNSVLIDPHVIHTGKYTLILDGEGLPLKPKLLATLVLSVRNFGRAVFRDALLHCVRAIDYAARMNKVHVMITWLFKTIALDHGSPVLRSTVRCAGNNLPEYEAER